MSDEKDRELAKKTVKLNQELKAPFSFRMEAEQAIEDYFTFETFKGGYPLSGGLDDQPAVWVDYITIISSAKGQVEYEARLAEQEQRDQEARKAKSKAKR